MTDSNRTFFKKEPRSTYHCV